MNCVKIQIIFAFFYGFAEHKHSLFKQFLFSLHAMKFFVFILSFFLLYIFCIPCGDRQECKIKVEQRVSTDPAHKNHQHTTEACSPFCSCSCFAASTFFISSQKIKVIKFLFQSDKHAIQTVSFLSQDFSSMWQCKLPQNKLIIYFINLIV